VRAFLQGLVLATVFACVSFGNDFIDIKQISLKKDEQKKILVKYASYERLFTFRWTLYINDGLVVFHSYDRSVAQNVLSLNTTNQSFRVELKPRGADAFRVPYLLVKFKKFDYKKNEALFEVLLWDDKSQIKLEYLN